MIRDWADDIPTWLAFTTFFIGIIGFIGAIRADSENAGIVFGLVMLFGGGVLLAKGLVAGVDAGAELVEITGRITQKYKDRLGERLPAGYTPPPYTVSMDPTGTWIVVSGTHYRVSGRTYESVDTGDVVVLTVRARDRAAEHPRVIELALATSSVALQGVADDEARQAEVEARQAEVRRAENVATQQREREEAKRSADNLSVVFRNWGIDALALDTTEGLQGDDPELSWSWIEVLKGPIRWVAHGWVEDFARDDSWSSFCLIPDARIGPGYPRVSVLHGIQLHAIRQWHVNDHPVLANGWKAIITGYSPLDHPSEKMLSAQIATQLNQNPATRRYDFEIESDLVNGCWIVMADVEFSRPLWDTWGAIAKVLLATPMPTGGSSAPDRPHRSEGQTPEH